MSPRRNRSEAARTEAPSFEVYDGRQCAGAVLDVGRGRFEAFDSEARLIGAFPNEAAATHAVLAAWRKAGG